MKNSRWSVYHLTLGTLLAGLLLMIGSWIGSLCDLPVRSMLSAEGIRWILQNLLPNVEASPWFTFFILVVGLGVLRESGLVPACRQLLWRWHRSPVLSRKRRQALFLAGLSLLFYLLLIGWATFSRYEILLGVTGTLERSPFLAGWPLLLAIALGLPGGIYGLASGKFQGLLDLICSLSSLLLPMAGFFVYLFGMAQWVGMFIYTRLDVWLGIPVYILSLGVYYLPFILYLFFIYGNRNRQLSAGDRIY